MVHQVQVGQMVVVVQAEVQVLMVLQGQVAPVEQMVQAVLQVLMVAQVQAEQTVHQEHRVQVD
jgi:hypothetical protein